MKIHCRFCLNKKCVGNFPKQNVIDSARNIICNIKNLGVQRLFSLALFPQNSACTPYLLLASSSLCQRVIKACQRSEATAL